MEVLYTTTEAARDTLALIRYKVEGNDEKFKETALAISRKLDSEGRCDAALFIRAQYNEIPTFIPMGISYVRPSKDAYYLGIAKAVAQRATCLRRIYGAVIVNNDEIVSTGYNGAPRGERNCCNTGKCYRRLHQVPHGQMVERCCLTGNTVIKLLDGTYKTIAELADEGRKDFWIYAVDTDTGEIVPAIASEAFCNGERDDLVKITFDNNQFITCTSDHKIMLRDCTYKEAGELVEGESVMPMYYNYRLNKGYEQVNNTTRGKQGKLKKGNKCKTNTIPTHQLVFKSTNKIDELNLKNKWLIHHIDGNRNNNVPSNLMLMDRGEHSRISMTPERIEILKANAYKGLETMRKLWNTRKEYREKKIHVGHVNMSANWANHEFRKRMTETINKENGKKTVAKLNRSKEMRRRMFRGQILKGLSLLLFRMKKAGDDRKITTDIYDELQKEYKSTGNRGITSVPKLKTIVKYFGSLQVALDCATRYNHKVLKIERIHSKEKVYDISVPRYHNFAVDLGDNSCVFVHNCAVHAEENAIISASRREMQGATLYLWGMDVETGKELPTPEPCLQCWRRIHNAGIVRVVTMGGDAHAPQSARRD